MKNIYFSLLFILFIFPVLDGYCQNEKVVTLSVSGQGKSVDEAKNIALRSALELAFGTFISSRTEIFNDELIGDEIVSLSNGNIQSFKIVSQTQLPYGGYTVSLIATVSVTKLTSFVENKGIEVEFKGVLFAENIKIQKLNEDAEYKAVLNLIEISKKILSSSLDFEVEVGEPTLAGDLRNETGSLLRAPGSEDLYSLLVNVKATPNKNHETFRKYFIETITLISMKENEIQEYNKINKMLFVLFNKDNLISEQGKKFPDIIYLRNPKTAIALQSLFIKSNRYLTDFNFNLLNLGAFDVICCSDDTNIKFYGDLYGWDLNLSTEEIFYFSREENIKGFPNFFFVDRFSREMPSWGYYNQYLNAIYRSSDMKEYTEFESDLYYFNPELIFEHVDPNPDFQPPSSNIFLENYSGISDKTKSIIGGFNFDKKSYLHNTILYLNLEDLEKITGFNIKPKFN